MKDKDQNPTTPEVKWLDEFHEALNDGRSQMYVLAELSQAFRRTGNDVVADELAGIVTAITLDLKQMSDAVGKDLTHQVQSSFNQIGSVFKAALDSCRAPSE